MFLGGQLGVVEICAKVEIVENNKDKHELYKAEEERKPQLMKKKRCELLHVCTNQYFL